MMSIVIMWTLCIYGFMCIILNVYYSWLYKNSNIIVLSNKKEGIFEYLIRITIGRFGFTNNILYICLDNRKNIKNKPKDDNKIECINIDNMRGMLDNVTIK